MRPQIGQRVRVYDGGGVRAVNGEPLGVPIGQITAVASDLIVSILVDLHGNGQPLTLVGVARREGSGNGWEPLED